MLDNTEDKNESVFSSEQQGTQYPINVLLSESVLKPTLKIKKKVITEEYKLAGQVLGIGINGKVWEIFQRKSGRHFALKVGYLFYSFLFDSFILSIKQRKEGLLVNDFCLQ